MSSAFVIKYKAKTRRDDNVTSQPWHIESIWEDGYAAREDADRQAKDNESFDYDVEEVDFYRFGERKP